MYDAAIMQEPTLPVVEPKPVPKYRGVGGWLLFFITYLTVLNPAWDGYLFFSVWQSYRTEANAVPFPLFQLIWPMRFILLLFGIYAGVQLWRVRPGAVRLAKTYLLAVIFQQAVELALVPRTFLVRITVLDLLRFVILKTLLPIIYVLIWYSYFNRSERVAATYSTATASSVGPEPISRLPVLWVGYLLAGALVVAEVVAGLQARSEALDVRELLLLISAAGAIYWLYCVYRFHDVMAQIPGYNHSITPWRAVAMHWIPFYNLYWVFKWPSEIATLVNWRMQSSAMKGSTAGLLVLLAGLVGRFVDSGIGLVLLFSSGVYISRYLRRALAAPPVPASAMAPPGARGPLGL